MASPIINLRRGTYLKRTILGILGECRLRKHIFRQLVINLRRAIHEVDVGLLVLMMIYEQFTSNVVCLVFVFSYVL